MSDDDKTSPFYQTIWFWAIIILLLGVALMIFTLPSGKGKYNSHVRNMRYNNQSNFGYV